MSCYFENNLQDTSNQNFGSSHINLQDYYVCREKWEIVIQDGAGVQLMKATNCDDSQMNCNEIFVPDYTPTTTTRIPTTTRRPFTTSPPATRTRAFFLDMENYLGTMSSDYSYFNSSASSSGLDTIFSHDIKFANQPHDLYLNNLIVNNSRNGSVGDDGGTAIFCWETPWYDRNRSQFQTKPVIRFAIGVPGIYRVTNDVLQNDPSNPHQVSGMISIKAYLESDTWANMLVYTQWLSLDDTPYLISTLSLMNLPSLPQSEDESNVRFRLELESNLGKDTIYTSYHHHPQWIGCLGGGGFTDRCDYSFRG
jgi:hypothetical protein